MITKKDFNGKLADAMLDISSLKESEKNKIISSLVENISAEMNLQILRRLKKEEIKELTELSKSKNKAKIVKYINSKVKNTELLSQQVTRKVINEFMALRDKNKKRKLVVVKTESENVVVNNTIDKKNDSKELKDLQNNLDNIY